MTTSSVDGIVMMSVLPIEPRIVGLLSRFA